MSRSNSDSDERESASSVSVLEEEAYQELELSDSEYENDDDIEAYADEEWLKEYYFQYNKKRENDKKEIQKLTRRKDGVEPTSSW